MEDTGIVHGFQSPRWAPYCVYDVDIRPTWAIGFQQQLNITGRVISCDLPHEQCWKFLWFRSRGVLILGSE